MFEKLNQALNNNTQFTKLKNKWQGITSRERKLIAITLFVMSLVFLYLVVIQPIQQFNQSTQQRVEDKRQIKNWLSENVEMIETIKRNSQSQGTETLDNSQPIASILENLSLEGQAKLVAERIVPKSENELEVWFEAVNFNELILWLNQLQLYRIDVSRVDINKVKASNSNRNDNDDENNPDGLVDAYLSLIKQ